MGSVLILTLFATNTARPSPKSVAVAMASAVLAVHAADSTAPQEHAPSTRPCTPAPASPIWTNAQLVATARCHMSAKTHVLHV